MVDDMHRGLLKTVDRRVVQQEVRLAALRGGILMELSP